MSGGQRVDILANPVDPAGPIYATSTGPRPIATVDNVPTCAAERRALHHDTLVLPPGLAGGCSTPDAQRSACAGTASRSFDASGARADRPQRRLGAAHRLHLGPERRTTAEALRLVRPLLRADSDGPRHPLVRLGAPAADLQLRPGERRPARRRRRGRPRHATSAILGGFTEPTDPDIKGQYVREFSRRRARGGAGRRGRGQGRLSRLRPGDRGLPLHRRRRPTASATPARGSWRDLHPRLLAHLPGAEARAPATGRSRSTSRKRFSDNWQGLASYVYSTLDGNFDGVYAPFTNVGADPNISAAYDYYDFFTDGARPRRGSPTTARCRTTAATSSRSRAPTSPPFKLSIGLSAYYRTGTPLTRYGYSDAYGRYEFFLDRARRRGPRRRDTTTPTSTSAIRSRSGRSTAQPPARHLQPLQHPAPDPARPALGLPGGRQRLDRRRSTRATARRCCAPRRPRRGWGCG